MAKNRNAVVGSRRRHISPTSATSLQAGLALSLFFVVTLHTAAESPNSDSPKASEPSYSISALPDTYAFAPAIARDSPEKQGLAWLDDHRVMFVGFRPDSADPKGLYIWDVVKNTVARYSSHTQFCFANGYISAFGPSKTRQDRTAESPVRQGILGKEQDDVCDSRTGKGCRGRLNMSCKQSKYFGKAPVGQYGRYIVELRSGDGAIADPVDRLTMLDPLTNKTLDEMKAFFSQPLFLVSERFPRSRALPVTALEQVIPTKVTYSNYGKLYVFVTERPKDGIPGYTSIWPPKVRQPVYLMTSEGLVEEVDVPPETGWSKIHVASLAVPGIVFLATAAPRQGWGGLFLYDKQRVWQLDRGQWQALAVSDNGCKVAYAIDNDFGKKPIFRFRIKLVRFC